jgi:hypothetical protein
MEDALMKELGGLQLEARCVKCGRLPTADITLFEMQNHLYICNLCRQDEERKGKRIAWVSGLHMEPVATTATASEPSATRQLSPLRTRPLTSSLPPGTVFAEFNLPLDTPISRIRDVIREQMRIWMKKPDSQEKKQMIPLLREWQEKIQDEEAFEEYRNSLKYSIRREGGTLSVGGRSVLTAQEFLDACEASREGWADGERYLRTGQLRQWIIFQLGDRALANEARRYQTWKVPDFRALNEMLYCLVPERSFRLYSKEEWEPPDIVPTASTAEELATLCDIHWQIGETHLYEGSMVFWLEHSRDLKGLSAYYNVSITGYAKQWADRGVGLELLLEHAVPKLPRPNLMVAFDGNVGSYTLKRWDREIPHRPISVTITNTTRGFSSVDIVLQPKPAPEAPDWIMMRNASLRGRPGAGMPATGTITLINLPKLNRGRKYRRFLNMSIRSEYGKPPTVEKFPITLSTMWFFQGLRGILWRWGLRGDLPGLLWNFAAGALLALLPFLLIPALIPTSYQWWYNQSGDVLSFNIILEAVVAGIAQALQFHFFHLPELAFPVIVGAILGFVGFWVGIGKGHTNYPQERNSSGFRKGAFWLSLIFAVALVFQDGGSDIISAAFQHGGSYNYYITEALQYGIGDAITGLLIFLFGCVVAFIHHRLEKYLRTSYQALLNPQGRA